MIGYLKQLNAFNERCLITGLAPRARVVYYTLLDMNNRLFWVSSFRTTIRIIADRSGLNKNAVDFSLRTLKNEGLIEYIPSNKKGTGSLISICPLYGTQTGTDDEICPDTGTQTGTESGTNIGTENKMCPSIRPDTGTQTGTDDEICPAICPSIRPDTGTTIREDKTYIAAAARAGKSFSEVVGLFERCIHPVSNEVERDELIDMIETDGYERVKDAIKEAAKNRAQSVKYIQAILNRWRKEGQHERRAGGSRRTHQSPDEDKRKWEREPNGWKQDLAI